MRPRELGRWAVLVGFALVLGACGGGGSKSPAGPSSEAETAFLAQHNAQFNSGRTVRWSSLPIPVFTNGIAREDEVTIWTGASGGAVTFAFGGGPVASGINFSLRSGTDICGVTTVQYNGGGAILAADVRVSGEIYRGPQCVSTVSHETAHAIGFLDHTSDGGLMDADGGNGRITSPVATMIRDLYSLPPGTVITVGESPRTALLPSGGRYTLTFVYYPVRR